MRMTVGVTPPLTIPLATMLVFNQNDPRAAAEEPYLELEVALESPILMEMFEEEENERCVLHTISTDTPTTNWTKSPQ